MNANKSLSTLRPDLADVPLVEHVVAEVTERSRMLEQLLKPLGVMSLMGVAHGLFANLRFRGNPTDFHVRPEDALNVQANDISALVYHAQQFNVDAVDGLAQVLSASPLSTGSAAAAMLIAILMRRVRARRERVDNTDASSMVPG